MRLKTLLMGLMGVLTITTFSSCSSVSDRSLIPKEKIIIGGSSEGYPLLEILAEAYENHRTEITFMPSSQTSGGVRGVKDGAIDIGVVARELTPAEKSDNIKYIPIAKNLQLLITNNSVKGVTNLSAKQIKSIYSGTITNWQELGGPDAKIVLLDIPEDETEKQLLRKFYLGENLQVTPTAIIFSEDDEILEAVATTPYSIGTVAWSPELEKFAVNILSIDSVAPISANMQRGEYKMIRTIGIVVSPKRTNYTQEFINFILSEAANKKLKFAGYMGLKNQVLQ